MNDVDELRSAANPIHEETCRDEHDENETPESDWPCMLLANRVLAASDQGGAPTTTVTMEGAGPEAGHTFEVSVRSRGSSGVLDGPKSDDDWWGEPSVLRVRAWNHNDAVAMAAQVPYPDWDTAE